MHHLAAPHLPGFHANAGVFLSTPEKSTGSAPAPSDLRKFILQCGTDGAVECLSMLTAQVECQAFLFQTSVRVMLHHQDRYYDDERIWPPRHSIRNNYMQLCKKEAARFAFACTSSGLHPLFHGSIVGEQELALFHRRHPDIYGESSFKIHRTYYYSRAGGTPRSGFVRRASPLQRHLPGINNYRRFGCASLQRC